MNFKSHIIMGNILCETLQTRLNIPLNRSEFIYGNVRPDIYPGFIARHTKDKFFAYVKSEIAELAQVNLAKSVNDDKSYSFRLGILCHYLTDFFCYPHNGCFHKSVLAHYIYEKRLCRFLKGRTDTLLGAESAFNKPLTNEAARMIANIEERHEEYLQIDHDFTSDVLFALDICTTVTLSLLTLMEKCTMNTLEGVYDENRLLYGHLLS